MAHQKIAQVTVRVLLILTTTFTALAFVAPAYAQTEGIHVVGNGYIEVEPDMGRVRMSVRREGADAAALKQSMDAVVKAVLQATRRLSIEPRDVIAAATRINPRYQRRDNESVVDGLIATRTIEITLRDLDRYSELLNQALQLGVNNVDPLVLDTSRREELEDEALELAMQDAQVEAARVAAGFSVALGDVVNVQLGSHSPRPQAEMMRASMASDGGSFSPGIIRVTRSLQATFSINAAK